MKVIDYKIAICMNPASLERMVAEMLASGWQPHGCILLWGGDWMQAMVKYEEARPFSLEGWKGDGGIPASRNHDDAAPWGRDVSGVPYQVTYCPDGTASLHTPSPIHPGEPAK